MYRIDDEHCNPKKVWEDMGSPLEMNASEIQKIKDKSALVEETVLIEKADGNLILQGQLNVNDLHCYVIDTK